MAWRPDDASPTIASPARTAAAVDDARALDDADRGAGQVERVGVHQPRVLGRLAADEGAARLAAAGRDAADELGDLGRIELADGDVVEERERLGAGADDVVDAHRDEVDADRVEAPDRRRDRGLGADAVGRGDEQRLAVAGRDGERAAEPAEPADAPRARRVDSTWPRISSTARSPAATSTPAAA